MKSTVRPIKNKINEVIEKSANNVQLDEKNLNTEGKIKNIKRSKEGKNNKNSKIIIDDEKKAITSTIENTKIDKNTSESEIKSNKKSIEKTEAAGKVVLGNKIISFVTNNQGDKIAKNINKNQILIKTLYLK